MKHYSLLPIDCDAVEEELYNKCGSLFPYITSKSKAISYAKSVKKQFPHIKLGLYEGERWGNLQLVKEF